MRDDLEEYDPIESYLKHRKDAKAAVVRISSEDTDEDVYAAAKAVDAALEYPFVLKLCLYFDTAQL